MGDVNSWLALLADNKEGDDDNDDSTVGFVVIRVMGNMMAAASILVAGE